MLYAERAYMSDDAQGAYIVGAAYYLHEAALLPEYIHVVSREEADEFLEIAAVQGYAPAIDLITYLRNQGTW